MANLSISLSAEPIFHLGSFIVTNSMLTSLISTVILVSLSLWARNHIKYSKKPRGLQNFLEMLIEILENLTTSITESSAKTKVIFPFVLCFFLFIVLNNWLGLLPGVGTIGYRHTPVAEHQSESATMESAESTVIPSEVSHE